MHFHLHTGVVDPLAAREPYNTLGLMGGSMLAIQIRVVAVVVPPSSLETSCTVSAMLVIVTIKGAKVHVIQ